MRLEVEYLEVGDIIWWKDSWVEVKDISINMNGKYILITNKQTIQVASDKKFLLM